MKVTSSLFTTISWPKAKRPKRAEVLMFLESVLPWAKLEEIARRAHIEKGKTGRPGYSTRMMVRIAVLQLVYRLSDDAAESMLLDSHGAASFAGLDPWRPRPPGASTIRNFRNLLEHHKLTEEMRAEIDQAFISAGAVFRPGTIIEPIIIKTPSRERG